MTNINYVHKDTQIKGKQSNPQHGGTPPNIKKIKQIKVISMMGRSEPSTLG
jgi:hypothetical protein